MSHFSFDENTTVRQLIDSGVYGPFADYFWTYITDDHLNNKLSVYGYESCGFEQTLPRLEAMAAEPDCYRKYFYDVYSKQQIYESHDKQEAKMIYFPVESADPKPYVIIIPGGGFARQWEIIEGLAIAVKFNELGYPAFVANYRTAQDGVVAKAMDDIEQTIRFIEEHAEQFNVLKSHYIMGGFSAGATLSCEYASDNLGWKSRNLPKPEMIFLGYCAHRMDVFYKAYDEAPEGSPARIGNAAFLHRIAGSDITWDNVKTYQLEDHLSKEISPALYLTANEDDPTVPFVNSTSLEAKAKELGIPVRTKFGKVGGHSYGIGYGREVEGWIEDAIDFWKSL